MSERLLVLAPLRVERLALGGDDGELRVVRTGMGAARARAAAARAQSSPAPAVAIAGFCAGVAPGLAAGDVVCASALALDGEPPRAVVGAEEVAAALAAQGLRVHVGTLATSARLEGPRRRARRRGAALALDMESAWLADGADGRPLAVVRVVVDAAGRSLADPRIVLAGVRGLRSLRRVRAALAAWARALEVPAADAASPGRRAPSEAAPPPRSAEPSLR